MPRLATRFREAANRRSVTFSVSQLVRPEYNSADDGEMVYDLSHGRARETLEARAGWFQSLMFEERMGLLFFFTDLILENGKSVM